MRREFVLSAVMATAMAVGVGAQTTPPSSSQTTPPSSSQSPSDQSSRGNPVTVTGCLMSGDQWKGGTAGTSGTTGATGAPGSTSASRSSGSGGFVLTDVSMGSSTGSYSSPSSTTGTSGTSPSASAGGASSSTNADKNALMLTGKDEDLQKHVGKRVEVRGTLDKSASSGDPSMTNPPSTAGTSGSLGGTLRVTSVKETSGSCSGGGNR